MQASRDQSQQLICFAQWASVAVTALGALVLVGWTIDSSPLKRILPGLVAMNPATAIAFIASGLALRLLSRPSIPPRVRHVAWSCTALTVVIAVTRLLAYAAGIDVGFDRLLFPEELARDHVPNRMAPNTAASFLLLGLGLLLLDVRTRRGHRPTEWCGVSALLIGLLTLVGYAFYIVSFRQVASYIPMALHTGAGFVLISAALLCARPDQGFMATLSGAGMGSQLARRLLPFAIGIPFGLGWLRLQGQDLGLYDTEFGLALTVLSSSLIFAVLIWWNARSLNRMDAGRRRAEQLERETISLEATLSERRRTERLKDQLLDIIAHELRIPVAVVQEGVNQLADGVLGPLNSDQQEGVALSRENIERLTVLIEKAVVATQLLTERVGYTFRSFDLRQLIARLEQAYRPLAERRGLSFKLSAVQSSLQCVGDIEWLQRALGQLVENAIEASPPKGAVTISCQEAPDASILTIEDTGAGIPSEVRPVLFDRLRAAGGIDERKTGGLGLGLFIAKSVIQAHGGVIDVEGAAGGGTRMTVHILRKPEASPSHAQVH